MLHNLNKYIWLTFMTLLISVAGARANPFVHVDCDYEGDGWFKYKVRLPVDPFWQEAFIGSIDFSAFGPAEQVEAPTQWAHDSSLGFTYVAEGGQVRPTEYVFRLKSPYRHFKRVNNKMLLIMSLIPQDWWGDAMGTVFSINLVGFANIDMIVPSPDSVADEPELPQTISLSLVPDARVEKVVMQGASAEGIRFVAPAACTYQVEGSKNLTDWTILCAGTCSGGTNGAFSSSISSGGPFYRVMLTGFANTLAGGSIVHEPDAGGVVKLIEGAQLKMEQAGLKVAFPSKVSGHYRIEFLDAGCKVQKLLNYTASSELSSVPVPEDLSSGVVLVRVSLISSASE